MKNLYAFLLLSAAYASTQAQALVSVAAGTDLNIGAGTIFSAGGLSMTPSAAFTLNGLQLNVNTATLHPATNPHVLRVYQFSANTNPFSGSFQFFYQDAELNGLSEPTLQLNIHDGSSWDAFASAVNDVTNNYVITNAVSTTVLNELTLASSLASLPLAWNKVSAFRQARQVNIQWQASQQYNVGYFTVERSTDGTNWLAIANNIPAINTANKEQYGATDNENLVSKLYYRVKEVDIDGRFSFSPVAIVSAIQEQGKLTIYPNPTTNAFSISNFTGAPLKKIQLFNNAGVEIKAWNALQLSYNIKDIAAGMYYLQIQFTDGSTKQVLLNKQ